MHELKLFQIISKFFISHQLGVCICIRTYRKKLHGLDLIFFSFKKNKKKTVAKWVAEPMLLIKARKPFNIPFIWSHEP